MITIKGEVEVEKVCGSSFWFEKVVRVVKEYWEAGPNSMCMGCCGIKHKQMGSCGDLSSRCTIYARLYKVEDHCFGVVAGNENKKKICVHVTVNCTNCGKAQAANSPYCRSGYKANIPAKKEKKRKEKGDKEKLQAYSNYDKAKDEKREKSPQVDTKINQQDGESIWSIVRW